jgi:hypothetical protein
MKHAQPQPPTEEQIAIQRLPLVEQQLADVSRRYIQLHARLRVLEAEGYARASIIRRRNADRVVTGLLLRWLLLAAAAVERPVLDTGTPGVEVTR